MDNILSHKQQSSGWLNWAIITSLIITVLGFLPWEQFISIEIRDETIATLIRGTLGLTGLFFLLAFLLIRIMRYNKWVSGLAMLVIPLVMIGLAFVWVISLAGPDMWQDITVYRNGDDYLILEGIVYGRDGVETDYRLVRTKSPDSSIRYLQEQHLLGTDEHKVSRFYGDKVLYNGKTWTKEPLK